MEENLNQKKQSKKMKILIILLSIITLLAISVTIWSIFFRDVTPTGTVSEPEYAPQQVEPNAEPIKDDSTSKLEAPQGGGAVSLIYSDQVTLSMKNKNAIIMFQNPGKSNQNMKIQLAIDEKIIASSGKLEPGYKVEKISNVDMDKLSAGNYKGKFIISFYNAQSDEKAILNTEIPVDISVVE